MTATGIKQDFSHPCPHRAKPKQTNTNCHLNVSV